MSDEMPSVEEIKERLKIEVEEEPVTKGDSVDIAAELKSLGRQFAETLQTAWNSEEWQKIETNVRDGVQSFVKEVDRVFVEAKESPTAEKVRKEAADAKTRVEASNLGQKTRDGMAQGLQWMSEELGKLATKFTPVEEESSNDSES